MASDKSNKKALSDKPMKIANGRPLSEAFLNTFFKVFSIKQMHSFEKLFIELEPKLKRINMNGEEFMKRVKDSYQRYQEFKKIDPFTPMDSKGEKYVSKFMREAIDTTYKGFRQKQV